MKCFNKLLLTISLAFSCLGMSAAIPVYLTIDPAPGSTVESISTFTIKSTMYEEFWVLGTSQGKILIDGEVVKFTSKPLDTARTGLIFTITEPITEPGEHEITFLEGVYIFDEDETVNYEFTFSYTVSGETTEPEVQDPKDIPNTYIVTPTPGSTVTELTTITVTSTVDDLSAPYSNAKLFINEEEVAFEGSVSNNVITYSLTTPITETGRYVVRIPVNSFDIDDWGEETNEPFEFVVYVEAEKEPVPSVGEIPDYLTIEPTPGSTVESISTFTISSTVHDNFWIRAGWDTKLLIDNEVVAFTSKPLDTQRTGLVFMITEPINKEGEHTITLLDGIYQYTSDNILNEAFSFTLTVGSDVPAPAETIIPATYSVVPEPNSIVTEISKITITSTVDDYFFVLRSAKVLIDEESVAFKTEITGNSDNVIEITLETPIVEEGVHTINIPANSFEYGDEYDTVGEFKFSLIVKAEEPEPDPEIIPRSYSVTPEPGSTVAEIKTITLTTISSDYINAPSLTGALKIGTDIDNLQTVAYTVAITPDGKTLTYTLVSPITEDGRYFVKIPSGSFDIDEWGEETNNPFEFVLYVEAEEIEDPEIIPSSYSVEPTPGSTVSEIKTISLTSTVDYPSRPYTTAKLYINEEPVEFTGSASGHTVTYTLTTPITETGRYVVRIPASSFDTDEDWDETNDLFEFVLYVDSTTKLIDEVVSADNAKREIYNIQGVRVENVQPGNIYIIRQGGKSTKVLVK
ncbi:MAG: hypothetical protein J1F05_00310 [Muribaculaceae bacterium]|nr:hypothetical protein [Muribaculaceae bacterium]